MKSTYQSVSEKVITLGIAEKQSSPNAGFSTDLSLDSLDMAELITLCWKNSTWIFRKEFGLTWNEVTEAGSVVVSDEIKIHCEVHLVKQE